jgi:flagellar motor protein MotB
MKLFGHGGCWLAALVLLGAGAGCANRMHDENYQLHEQNRELQARLDAENARRANDSEMPAQSARAVEPMVPAPPQPQAVPATQSIARPLPATPPQIEGTETTSDPAAGTVTVRVPGDVLFDPGQATIRTGAKATLDKVAAALKKEYPGKQIRVEGHTDADPIRVSKWKSNQDLSEARALAVKQYLAQKGVDNASLTTRGFAADKPRSPTDKALNRRVEIVVVTR